MDNHLDLPEPLKYHTEEECRVCGEELPYPGTRLCDRCRETLRDMERKRWLGEEGPVAVFLGIAYRKFSIGISLTEEAMSDRAFPIMPPTKKGLHLEWGWNPSTQRMEQINDPPEEVVWLFWGDREDGQTKSKVFWGMGEAFEYVSLLQAQGHTVTKAGIKIFPIRGGE